MLFAVANGGGLFANPSIWQVILAVIVAIIVVFALALHGVLGRFIRGIFDKRQRLGGPYD